MEIPVLVTSDANIFYFTGFVSSNAVVILHDGQGTIITDFRYEQAAKKTGFPVFILKQGQKMEQGIAEFFAKMNIDKVFFEAEHMSADRFLKLSEVLEMIPADEEFGKARAIKEDDEVEIMISAAKIANKAVEAILPKLTDGVSEKDIAVELEYTMRKLGASEPSFDTIVAFGANASMPHYVPADVKLKSGDCVLIDIGAKFDGYCSDMTRTYFFGESELKEVYDVVLRAQQAAIEAVRPGISCKDLDGIARGIIEEAGFGDKFGHGLGHGVGIDIHEYPFVNKTSEAILKPGMVITIEPGIYLPDRGGIRIEDMVLVTENGYKNLTNFDKEYTTI